MSDLTMSLDGVGALVTGAASGIGRRTAELFREAGAEVTACDIHGVDPSTRHGTLRAVASDLSTDEGVRLAVAETQAGNAPLGCLVHCAGIMDWAGLDGDLEHWNQVVNTNLTSAFLLLKHAVPHMLPRGGSIVLIGSISGINGGIAAGPAYVASKAGVHGLVKWAAKQFAPQGIRVNAVAPGTIQTPLAAGADEARALTPLGRGGEPLDIARAALYLSSAAGSFVTGAIWVVDGGLTI